MKTLRYTKAHHAGKLHGELQAAIPSLRPTRRADGYDEAVYTLSSQGNRIELGVPDDIDEQAVETVIEVHTSNAPAPTQDELDLEEIKAALAGSGNLTASELKKALRFIFRHAGLDKKVAKKGRKAR